MSGPEREDKDQLWSEATLWFARMRSPDAEEFRPEFEEWLSRDALHRRYYNRASEHWLHGTAAYAEERARIHGNESQRPEPHRGARSKRGVIAAIVASSVLVAGSTVLVVTRNGNGDRDRQIAATQAPARPLQFATAAGEQRAVRLADGSSVMFSENTLLQVQLGDHIRRLELDRGTARFDVAHEARPFVVFAGGGSITAHGTLFDVGLGANHRVLVRLIRGSVDVRLPVAARPGVRPTSQRLLPGETVTFEAAVAGASGRSTDSPAQTAAGTTTEAARDYRDVRLDDIVSEANRHAAVPIRLANPAIGTTLVSGRFRIDDTAVLAERLAVLFDLDVDRRANSEILLRYK